MTKPAGGAVSVEANDVEMEKKEDSNELGVNSE